MPLVEILHHRDVPADALVSLRDALQNDVAEVIGRYDQAHELTSAMVDLRVIEVGPLDRVRPQLLVTVLARDEPERSRQRMAIIAALTETVTAIFPDTDAMVELVLTNRVSIYEYPT